MHRIQRKQQNNNRKDVTPIEMDIKIAELFKESRQNSKIRDAQLAMPTSRIPDLD